MTRSKISLLLIFSVLLVSSFTVLHPVNADSHIIPKLGEGQPEPVLDGNITSTEWNTSVSFDTSLHNQQTSVFVTTNASHLFIGFNISTTEFISVNDTVPTLANYTLGYNNETHDWFALVLDNNLDKAETTSSIGTTASPDDALVIDQYVSGAYDAFANGSSSDVFVPDQTITYTAPDNNETTINGTDGSLDGLISRNVTSNQVIYEVVKPLDQLDEEGHDFLLSKLGVLQFKLFQWKNEQANATLRSASSVDSTEWFSLRINDTGTGLATETPSNTTINVVHDSFPEDQLDALQTVSNLYGFDLAINSGLNVSLNSFDLNVFFVDGDSTWTTEDISTVTDYVRSGGNAILLLGDTSVSSDVADKFELEFLSNQVLTPINVNESNADIEISSFTDQLSFLSGDAAFTQQPIDSLSLQTSALNASQVFEANNIFILDQEFLAYDLFEAPSDAVYDESGDGIANDTESFADLSLGIAMDFLKGGRATLIPSTSVISDTSLGEADNINYLLRLIPWNARLIDTLNITGTDTDKRTIVQGDSLTVSVNLTDGFGEFIDSDVTVMVEVTIAGNVRNTVLLEGNDGLYTTSVEIQENGFMELEFTAFKTGYGFAEGETQSIFVERRVGSFNDLSELSIIVIALFLISLASIFWVYTRVRTY